MEHPVCAQILDILNHKRHAHRVRRIEKMNVVRPDGRYNLAGNRDVAWYCQFAERRHEGNSPPMDLTHFARKKIDRRLPNELRDIKLLRLIIDRFGSADLDDGAFAHHRDTIGYRHRLALIVGDIYDGLVELELNGFELLPKSHADCPVQVRHRLV